MKYEMINPHWALGGLRWRWADSKDATMLRIRKAMCGDSEIGVSWIDRSLSVVRCRCLFFTSLAGIGGPEAKAVIEVQCGRPFGVTWSWLQWGDPNLNHHFALSAHSCFLFLFLLSAGCGPCSCKWKVHRDVCAITGNSRYFQIKSCRYLQVSSIWVIICSNFRVKSFSLCLMKQGRVDDPCQACEAVIGGPGCHVLLLYIIA